MAADRSGGKVGIKVANSDARMGSRPSCGGGEEAAAVEGFLTPRGAPAAVGRRWRTTSTTAKAAPIGCPLRHLIFPCLTPFFQITIQYSLLIRHFLNKYCPPGYLFRSKVRWDYNGNSSSSNRPSVFCSIFENVTCSR